MGCESFIQLILDPDTIVEAFFDSFTKKRTFFRFWKMGIGF
jgi:hypothetical protein